MEENLFNAMINDDQYDGSRIFTWLAELCGLSVDLVNFLLTQISALFLASLFRSLLHPTKVSSGVRHAFGLTIGLLFGYFCFGQQAFHIAGLPALCYVVLRTQNPQIVQRLVLVVALLYLSCVHLHRLYFDYGSPTLDITGPLMIITQKVTTLAFSVHDGLSRDENELTKSQRYHAVRKIPTVLEYFAYVLHFQTLMAGPMVLYKDYMEFIEGYHILKHSPSTNGNGNLKSKHIVVEPSPMKAVVKKVIGSVICVFIFMKFSPIYPIRSIKDGDFMKTSLLYKFWFLMMSTTVVRFKYYHAWLLSDAICNNSGLGFDGYDKDGNANWDMISNINVISFELATNFRDAINNWNMGTNRWLRNVVYERVPKRYGTLLTFSLSALWHGFYPGYYITFATGALIVMAARTFRKLIRHHFQNTKTMSITYDILTVLTTRIFMGYATFPFVLLEFQASLHMYLNLYLCLHLVTVIVIFAIPILIRKTEKTQSPQISSLQKSATATINHDEQEPSQLKPKNNNEQTIKQINNGFITNTNNLINDKKLMINSILDNNKCDKNKINNSNHLENLNSTTKILNTNTNNNNNNSSNNTEQTNNGINNSTKLNQNNNNNNNFKNTITKNGFDQNLLVLELNKSTNYRGEPLDKDNLSFIIRQKIDTETRNIENFIVTGIGELKDDLMKMNDDVDNNLNNGTTVLAVEDGSVVVSGGCGSSGLRKRTLPLTPTTTINNNNKNNKQDLSENNHHVFPSVNIIRNGHAK